MELKKILVIDDSETHNFLCESLFDNDKYRVFTTENGKAGFSILKKHLPNIILLDLMLPEMDGFAILKKMKKDEKTANIPVIIVSARNDKKDIKKAKELGAIDYIEKPINSDYLVSRVEEILA